MGELALAGWRARLKLFRVDFSGHLRQAKVHEPEHVPAEVDQEICGLDVSVDDAEPMDMSQRTEQITHVPRDLNNKR